MIYVNIGRPHCRQRQIFPERRTGERTNSALGAFIVVVVVCANFSQNWMFTFLFRFRSGGISVEKRSEKWEQGRNIVNFNLCLSAHYQHLPRKHFASARNVASCSAGNSADLN